MKKLLILSIMISLFAFWGSKNEVNTVHAEEVAQEAGETSAMFFENSKTRYLTNRSGELSKYCDNIVNLSIQNKKSPEPTGYIERIMIRDCTYTDENGATTPNAEVIFAYLSNASGSTAEAPCYKCVLYANVDKIYANPNSSFMFANFTALKSIDISILDTSKVTDMSYMFSSCMELESLIWSNNFKTSNVENMKYMFNNCFALSTLDLSNFDTKKVTDMSYMFNGCESLASLDSIISTDDKDETKFVTTNVTNMDGMFQDCSSLTSIDLSQFDTTNVTNMNLMFSSCTSLTELNLSNFKTSNVTNMGWMFYGCRGLTKIDFGSNFDTSNVTTFEFMFYYCLSLIELDISSFNLKKCNDRSYTTFEFIGNCEELRVLKLPTLDKIFDNPDPNKTVILFNLPRHLQNFYGFYYVTSDNIDTYSVLKWSEESYKFVSDWRNLRAAGEAEETGKGICAALVKGSALYSTLIGLLETYDAFDEDSRKYIDIAIDKDDVTIGESIRYVKNVIDGTQTANVKYGLSNEDSGSYMTIILKEESPYLIVVISLIGILSVLGYYFYSKKKQTM